MRVDVTCRKCGERRRLEVGRPEGKHSSDVVDLVKERLSHQPSFQCFGGHFELAPPVPRFWEVDWSSYGP